MLTEVEETRTVMSQNHKRNGTSEIMFVSKLYEASFIQMLDEYILGILYTILHHVIYTM